MAVKSPDALSIFYFEEEGRQNLVQVVRILKRLLRKREGLRSKKFVFFTAFGEGPLIAYNQFQEFDVKIIAVTFPRSFMVKVEGKEHHPDLSPKIRAFFDGVGIKVLSGRLPFDSIEGAEGLNREMKLVKDVLTTISGSFPLCIQAVLQSCDMGEVEPGEQVVAITGDCAALVTASTSNRFLSGDDGLVVNEILCKPRNLNLARRYSPKVISQPLLFGGPVDLKVRNVPELQEPQVPRLQEGKSEEE
ncbi:MAG: hypothetical protein ABSD13_15695 [Candidatus Korobacteraceae bacterium]|jgi:hypothetical protein